MRDSMPYKRRIPPIKIELNQNSYNKLVECVNSKIKNDSIDKNLEIIKNKLLRYSIPDNDIKNVEIRLYLSEAKELIEILINSLGNIEPQVNYYETLLKVREKIKEKYI